MAALIALFVFIPIAELYVILKVGDLIGILPTLALLVADSLFGAWLMRSQGRAVWRRFQGTMEAGRIPHREVFDGVLVIFGGAFLITPGFLTDIVGAFLLLPPTRALIRRLVRRRIERRAVAGAVGGARRRSRRRPGGAGGDGDVEGSATEIE